MKLLVVALCGLWMLVGQPGPAAGAAVGELAPPFALTTLEGKRVTLAELRGEGPVLLYFWATWCWKCKRELPALNRVAAELGPRGLVVLGINVGVNDSPARVRAYRDRHGIAFPLAFDRGGRVSRSFGVWGVPTFMLVDREGVVRFRRSLLPEDLEAYVAPEAGPSD